MTEAQAEAESAALKQPQGQHYFDVIDALSDPQSALARALLALGLSRIVGDQKGKGESASNRFV